MSNTFTNLVPVLYGAAQIVPRELVGGFAAVDTRFDDKRVALDDSVKIPIIPQGSAADYTPAMTTTAGSDTTPTAISLTLNNHRQVSWNLTGEEERSLENGGDNIMEFMRQSTEQAIRTIMNEIEEDINTEAVTGASRAIGTAGTTPFGSTLTNAAALKQVLDDNGAARFDRSIVMDTDAGMNVRELTQLTNVNQAGSSDLLRDGELGRVFNFAMRESGSIYSHSAIGTAANYDSDGGEPIGEVTLHVDTGTGTVLARDVISFADTAGAYVVKTGFAGDGDSDVVINKPGLRATLADGKDMTLAAVYAGNYAIQKNALVVAMRAPLIPNSPLIEQTTITDEKTGATFLFNRIIGDGMVTYRIMAVWGQKAVQPEAIALLLG